MKEERNDDQVLVRLPKSTKDQIEMVARIEGMTTQEWIREAMKSRLCLQNVCPNCSTVNTKKARFCNQCGTSLVESRRSMYREWMLSVIREEAGCSEGAALAEQIFDLRLDGAKEFGLGR